MRVEATRKLFNVDEYHRMAEAGIFGPEERVELIDGEIIEMSPIGSRHMGCVNRLIDAFTASFRGRATVSPQNSVRLSSRTEPQPDLALLRFREDYYASKTPDAGDALLILEVSDTTLRFDREIKLPRYAAAGVREVWIADLDAGRLLVHREPSGTGYEDCQALERDDSVSVAHFPDVVFKVAELIG